MYATGPGELIVRTFSSRVISAMTWGMDALSVSLIMIDLLALTRDGQMVKSGLVSYSLAISMISGFTLYVKGTLLIASHPKRVYNVVMSKSKDVGQTSISNASSPEEIAQFWDTHSLDDYWDETHEVAFEVRAQRRRRVTLDPDLYEKIEAQVEGEVCCQRHWSTSG
jgi:hypothetical protein